MNKRQIFEALFINDTLAEKVLFYPDLEYFEARFNGRTYVEFASDYKVLVETNIS